MKDDRGSALVTVILVILVLTVVGVGIAYFTSVEDRISGNTRISNAAFYVADSGLRKGEEIIRQYAGQLSQALNYAGARAALTLPGEGYPAYVLDATGKAFVSVADQKEWFNVPVLPIDPNPGLGVNTPVAVDRGRYDLYVRNNAEDTAGDKADSDGIVNLISVGHIVLPGGAVTKILEEQLISGIAGGTLMTQKLLNAGGTSTSNVGEVKKPVRTPRKGKGKGP